MKSNPKVLTVFVDGLKPSSIDKMPFLNSMRTCRRLRTGLGYSITCHATMYTGVYPDKHHMWFIWKYSPDTSPFKYLDKIKALRLIDFLPTRILIARWVKMLSNNTSYAGIGTMKYSSLKNWPHFDVSENKLWNEEGYVDGFPTIFEILKEKGISQETVGLKASKENGGDLSHIKKYHPPNNIAQWVYLFIGDVDKVSHFFTQESQQAYDVLRAVDLEIERVFTEIKNRTGEEPYLLCFSDHGHMRANKQFDIYDHFESHGVDLHDKLHIIDINYARFWFKNSDEEKIVVDIMESAPSGFFLTDEHYQKYRTKMPDSRYGDAIYYLDAPYIFKRTAFGYGLRTVSAHGYLPDYPEKDGVFISNLETSKENVIELVDIAPSILDLMGVETEYLFDGCAVW